MSIIFYRYTLSLLAVKTFWIFIIEFYRFAFVLFVIEIILIWNVRSNLMLPKHMTTRDSKKVSDIYIDKIKHNFLYTWIPVIDIYNLVYAEK